MTYEPLAVDAHLLLHAADQAAEVSAHLVAATDTIGKLLEGAGASEKEIAKAAAALAEPLQKMLALEETIRSLRSPPIPTAQEIEEARHAHAAKPARRLVLVGGKLGGRSFYEAVVGAGALGCGRTTDQEFAAASDEPPEVA